MKSLKGQQHYIDIDIYIKSFTYIYICYWVWVSFYTRYRYLYYSLKPFICIPKYLCGKNKLFIH